MLSKEQLLKNINGDSILDLEIGNHKKEKVPKVDINKIREEIEKITSLEESETNKITQLKQLEKEQYKPLIHELAYKKSVEELKDLIIVLNDLGYLTCKLGELSGDLKYYTEAAVFYHYIIAILTEKFNESVINVEAKNEFIISNYINPENQLVHLQNLIFSVIGGDQNNIPIVHEEAKINKNLLLILRNETTEVLKEVESYRKQINVKDQKEKQKNQVLYVHVVKNWFEEIADRMKKFLAKLYGDSVKQIAINAPCKFAVIGLGSMALKQMTPYSDLEFAILTQNSNYKKSDDPKIKSYFNNLSHLVNFKIINLGESIIPTSKYLLDMSHLVPVAVSFDLGGKTPLGRISGDKKYELIQTINRMLSFVYNKNNWASHIDKNLPYILEKVCFVYGDDELVKDYKNKVTNFLLSTGNEKNQKLRLNCEIRAFKILQEGIVEIDYLHSTSTLQRKETFLKGDIHKLKPELFYTEGRLFQVKQEIYRLPDRMVYNLALCYGIEGESAWDLVDKLENKGIINSQAALNLKNAITFVTTIRLKTYSHHKAQKEDMSIFVRPVGTEYDMKKQATQIFYLDEEDLQEQGGLFQYFYTALPLYDRLKCFCDQYQTLDKASRQIFFKDSKFYNDDYATKGFIHYRLAQYKEVQSNLEKALEDENNKDNLKIKNYLGNILLKIGENNKATQHYIDCLNITKKIYKDERHPSVADCLNNLGTAYNAKGQYNDAVKWNKASLKIYKFIYQNEPHLCIANSLNNLGEVFRNQGQYEKAIKKFRKSLSIKKLFYKDEPHSDIASIYNNLGLVFGANEQYDQAIKCYKKSKKIYQLVYKNEPHPYVADVMNNLGIIYKSNLQYDQAIKYYRESLNIYKFFYQSDLNQSVADIYNNLGLFYIAKNDNDTALKYCNLSFEIYNRIYQDKPHPNIAYSLNNLGLVYWAKEHFDNAINYFKESIKMKKLVYQDKNHPSVADSLNNLGSVYRNIGQCSKAMEYYKKSLNMRKLIFQVESHPAISVLLCNIGLVYNDMGKYDSAINYFKKSLEMKTIIFENRHHLSIAHSLNGLGLAYSKIGQYNTAVKHLEESLKIQKCMLHNQPCVAESLNNLGIVYRLQGKYNQAIKKYEESLEMLRIIYKEADHPIIACSLNNLGLVYADKKEYNLAIDYYKKSIKMQKRIKNMQSELNISDSLFNLGLVYLDKEQYDWANNYHKKSLKMKKLIYKGESHKDVASFLNNLGNIYQKKGQFNLAISYYKKCLKINKEIYKKKQHTHIADSFKNLWKLYIFLERFDEAVCYIEESLQVQKLVYQDGTHSCIADLLYNLGDVYQKKGSFDQAIEYYRQSLMINKQLYQDDPQQVVANIYNNLGAAYYAKGQHEQAIDSYDQSLKIIKQIYKDQVLGVAFSLNNLGVTYKARGEYDQAIKNYKQSLNIYKFIYQNETHITFADTLHNLGLVYADQNQHKLAINYYEESLKMKNIIYQDKPHPSISYSLNDLGLAYSEKKQYDQAIKYHSQALQMISVFQNHPYTELFTNNLKNNACLFAQKYYLSQKEIVDKVLSFTSNNLNFLDFKLHFQFASSHDNNNKSEEHFFKTIEEYKLALIFLPKNELSIKYEICNKIAELTTDHYKDIELWLAVVEDNIDEINNLAADGTNFNKAPFLPFTPIDDAVFKGNINMVSALISGKIDINKPNNNQQQASPLICSLGYYGQPINMEIVELLLANGADVNKPMFDGDIPMHFAHYKGSKEAINLLLKHRAKINAQNAEGKTPLHCLLETNSLSSMTKLEIIEEFGQLYDITIKDKDGKTVIEYANEYCPELTADKNSCFLQLNCCSC
ncbi:uncharacterized protein LOC124808396 isoform X1 [Hydra vulgaris]|uniref:uncharacterized protein LOC124808396 isoform X1 n=1 Tax=Hydra vulgaris TaxID=6087 RepID=UPI001F5E79E0|nr:uncharacterized protein LOC124808396 [Hydra vulgaris]